MLTRLWTVLLFSSVVQQAVAQYHFNIGGGPGFSSGDTSTFANTSYNFVVGGGVSLAPHVMFNPEFMFHGLPVKKDVANKLGIPFAKGRLYAATGNLILGSAINGEHTRSAYLLGGGGWYWRTVEAQASVHTVGQTCSPEWIWWNIECESGIFEKDVTIGSRTSDAGGFNVGGGVIFSIGQSANFYIEARYHRAFTSGIDTSVVPLTFGLRW